MPESLPFSPSLPPKLCNVVQTKLAPQKLVPHFSHSPSPLGAMSMMENFPAGAASTKLLICPPSWMEFQPMNAQPWKDQIASLSVRLSPVYAAVPRLSHIGSATIGSYG